MDYFINITISQKLQRYATVKFLQESSRSQVTYYMCETEISAFILIGNNTHQVKQGS